MLLVSSANYSDIYLLHVNTIYYLEYIKYYLIV
ncbi:hypothetical protein BCI_0084 [Baumannia cicadellinicola str. Hc (Homalodisca coagulata)]|uniref:Uncharacterized protein n=1 Tax=Baumannia cicadellinicola subsp. Homalodisca coagulata TaxID=374463 RepID=Q1LU02_BAUCH|nr:hypothetical protein BCI_0084 [Baumannia cicadellinicola str. Hc (Homalodisca coagulata)]